MPHPLYDSIQRQAIAEGKKVTTLTHEMGFAPSQISDWKNDRREPQQRSWDKYHAYMTTYRKEHGFPDVSRKEEAVGILEGIEQERKMVESMTGFKDTSGDRELNALQDEWEHMLVIHAVIDSSYLSLPQKRKWLGNMFKDFFPESSKLL